MERSDQQAKAFRWGGCFKFIWNSFNLVLSRSQCVTGSSLIRLGAQSYLAEVEKLRGVSRSAERASEPSLFSFLSRVFSLFITLLHVVIRVNITRSDLDPFLRRENPCPRLFPPNVLNILCLSYRLLFHGLLIAFFFICSTFVQTLFADKWSAKSLLLMGIACTKKTINIGPFLSPCFYTPVRKAMEAPKIISRQAGFSFVTKILADIEGPSIYRWPNSQGKINHTQGYRYKNNAKEILINHLVYISAKICIDYERFLMANLLVNFETTTTNCFVGVDQFLGAKREIDWEISCPGIIRRANSNNNQYRKRRKNIT